MDKLNLVFKSKINELLDIIEEKEAANISNAAKIIFDTIVDKKLVHVFATGHSHMFAEEMFYRAGGLVQINPVLIPYLMQHEGAVSSTQYERVSGIAKIVYDGIDKKDNEPFIIVSNSGINAVPIEMAELARKDGRKVIAVTSVEASSSLISRVENNVHLYEIADVVIDNHVPYGDGAIESKYGKIGSCSSIVGAYIAQRLVLEVIDLCEKNGIDPLIYKSANTGGDDENKKKLVEYKQRVRSLY